MINSQVKPHHQFLEYIDCPLCGNNNNPFDFIEITIADESYVLGINYCADCSHCYISPRLNSNFLTNYYNDIFLNQTDNSSFSDCFNDDIDIGSYIVGYKYITKYLPRGGKILDVGCGVGNLMAQLKDNNQYEITGIDISQEAVDEARKRGYDVLKGSLDDHLLKLHSFDLITLLHVLEHMSSPIDLLSQASDLLRQNGFIIIIVPNYYYIRFINLVRTLFNKPKNYWAIEHLHNFTPHSLKMAVTKSGFELIEIGFGSYSRRGSLWMIWMKKLTYIVIFMLSKIGIILGDITLIAKKIHVP